MTSNKEWLFSLIYIAFLAVGIDGVIGLHKAGMHSIILSVFPVFTLVLIVLNNRLSYINRKAKQDLMTNNDRAWLKIYSSYGAAAFLASNALLSAVAVSILANSSAVEELTLIPVGNMIVLNLVVTVVCWTGLSLAKVLSDLDKKRRELKNMK